jgi:transcriptional regulator with XRE-family HTH domain
MSRKKCAIDENSLGGRLRMFREARGFNIVKFSKLLGISHGSLSGIENNKRYPPSVSLKNLVQYTNINIHWLYFGEGEKTRGAESEKKMEVAEEASIYKVEVLDSDPGIADLLKAAKKVLKSGNQVAYDALERNIRYFDHAIETEKRLRVMESRLEDVEKRLPQKPEDKNTKKKVM